MSRRIKANWPLMQFITSNVSHNQLKKLLTLLNPEQVNALGEVAANVLYGTIPITDVQRRKLKRYSTVFEYLGNSGNSVKKRKAKIQKNLKGIILLLNAAKPLLQK